MLISLEQHGIFRSIFAYSCMSTLSNHWHAQPPFMKDEALLSINLAGHGQLVKMLIPLEPRIFGSNFVYLYISTLYNHWICIQNVDEASPSINSASRGLFVKMLITLEPHGIFFYQILHTTAYTF